MCLVPNASNDHPVDVNKDFIKRRGYFRWGTIELRKDCTRLIVSSNPPLGDVFAIICDPIGEFVQPLPKFLLWNIAESLSIFHCDGTELQATRWKSKGKAKAEMERAEIFVGMRIGIDPVIETDRPDR